MYLGGVGVQGVCLGVGVSVQEECVYLGGVGVQGTVCLEVGMCVQGMDPKANTPPGPIGRHPLPTVNRMTHRCKNITLPQTPFVGGNDRKDMVTFNNFLGYIIEYSYTTGLILYSVEKTY